MQCQTSSSLIVCQNLRRPYVAATALATTFGIWRNESTAAPKPAVVKTPKERGVSQNRFSKVYVSPNRLFKVYVAKDDVELRGPDLAPLDDLATLDDDEKNVVKYLGTDLGLQTLEFARSNQSLDQWRTHMRLLAGIKNYRYSPQAQKWTGRAPPIIHKVLDYKADVLPLLPEMNDHQADSRIPWNVDRRGGISGRQVLGEEVNRFSMFMQTSDEEKAARRGIFAYTSSILEAHNANRALRLAKDIPLQLELHGSVRSGLGLTVSDIDFRIFSNSSDDTGRFGLLRTGFRRLFANSIQPDGELIMNRWREARFPLISCQHRASGIDIQIILTKPCFEQRAATTRYLEEFPLLTPLYIVLRQALSHRGLLDVFYGGLSSYPLQMMIVAVLIRAPNGRQAATPEAITDHLLRFLDFYGNLNTRDTGLAVDPPASFGKHAAKKKIAQGDTPEEERVLTSRRRMAKANTFLPYLLTLQDPADRWNDLGCRTYAIKHVFATFRALHRELTNGIKSVDEGQKGGQESILLPLVGYCHGVHAERRSRAEAFGREVLASEARGEAIKSTGEGKSYPQNTQPEIERIPSPYG